MSPATGPASCTVSSTSLAFGEYSPLSASASDFTATITVTCTTASGDPVAIDGQLAVLSVGSGRRLKSGSRTINQGELRYQIFLDAARSIPWGDGNGSGGTAPVAGSVSANAVFRQRVTVYGRILARQTRAAAGSYEDNITVVLEY